MSRRIFIMLATLVVLTSAASSQQTIDANGEGYWLSIQNRVANIIQGEAPSGMVFESGALAMVAPPNSEVAPFAEEDIGQIALTPEATLLRGELLEDRELSRRTREPITFEAPLSTNLPVSTPIQPPATLPPSPTIEPTSLPATAVPTQVQSTAEMILITPVVEAVVTTESTQMPRPPMLDQLEQSCEAEAIYISPPGTIPVIIEWSFTGTNIDSVLWEFHDGTTSTSSPVQFTYDTPGTYSVVLHCYGPLGEIVVNNSVEITEASGTDTGIITITPPPSDTPTITRTPSITRTPTRTITPGGPSLTPTLTNTPRPPTNTRTPTLTATPETICEIGVLPDPNTPGAYTFFLTENVNVENVVWHINGQTYYGTEITALFLETGVYEVTAECISAYDIVEQFAFVEVEIVTSIDIGEGTALATYTATFNPQPQASDTPVPPTNVPPTEVPPASPIPPQPTSEPTLPAAPPANANGWTSISVGAEICVDWIVYHTDRTQSLNIFRLGELPNGETGNENLSRGIGEDVYSLAPSLSPDKRWVAFSSNRDGNLEIFISHINREEILQLTFIDDAQNFNPVWSPTGRYILFESTMGSNTNLMAFDLATGTYSRLTNDPGREMNASWSPDGERLVFQSDRDGKWQIYEMTLATREQVRLSDGVSDDSQPVYSHDGTQIVFHALRDSENALYLMTSSGMNITRISETADQVDAHTWSPDDRLIAYQSDVSGTSQLYVYEPESDTTRQVTDGTAPSYAPTWKCDSSEAVIFTHDLQEKSELFSANTYPLDAPSIIVADQALNLTNSEFEDGFPEGLTAQNDALGRAVDAAFRTQESMVDTEG